MATIPAVHTRWREKATGQLVEVEAVTGPSRWLPGWTVLARVIERGTATGDYSHVNARAHWFTTEGYEHVPS